MGSLAVESCLYATSETSRRNVRTERAFPMTKDELVVSLLFGAMATHSIVLVWGRRLVDLLPVWAFGG